MEYLSHNESETEAIAARLAATLDPGAVVAYQGGLGMGKTAFTRGLASGLGYPGRVTSPTFTIVNEYEGGRLPLFHFDMYRLADSEALFDIGWEDYLERGGVCAVEWSENVADAMENAICITIEKTGEESRRITLEGGDGYADLSL
jgi:tRNA threonylcarbamoyladenosine biosynthesis protein TsaE